MEATPERFANRCLPLRLANESGWEIVLGQSVTATWDGGKGKEAIRLDQEAQVAASHFGEGILTFHVPFVFRTPEGWNLWVQGPPNAPRDGLQALSGLVETDRTAATFTMNYAFTRPTRVRFEAGEAIGFLTPMPRTLEDWEPELRALESDPRLAEEHRAWAEDRGAFLEELPVPGSQANRERSQGDYARAANARRVRLKGFESRR